MIILGTNSIKDTGFDVANSLRFNSGSSDYLNKTLGTATNVNKYTFSAWIKRSLLTSSFKPIFGGTGSTLANYHDSLFFNNITDKFIYQGATSGSTEVDLHTSASYRDVSAWYHVVVAYDSTQSTASNRVKIYINGVQETSFSTETYPAQNRGAYANGRDSSTITISKIQSDAVYFDGYMAEVVLIDGQQLDADQFGEFDSDSGIWKPIDVSGLTFGNNGFYLDFEDSSALGNDAAGSNNFTVNNLTALDQSTDTCTNNFATMNPLDNFYAASTFSDGNCKMVTGGTPNTWNTSTFGVSKGKWYCEIKLTNDGSGGSSLFGIADRPTVSAGEELGGLVTTYAYLSSGQFRTNNTNTANSVSSADGDIIGIALDLDSSQNTISYYKNGTLIVAAQNITAPVSGNYFIASGDWLDGGSDVCTYEHNFGNPTFTGTDKADANGYGSFEYSPTIGGVNYYSLCTKNLSEFG